MRSVRLLQARRQSDAQHDRGGDEAPDDDRREHWAVAAGVVAQIARRRHAEPLREDEERAHASRDRAVVEPAEGGAVETREERRVPPHRVPVEDDVAGEKRHASRLPEEEDAETLETEAHRGDPALIEAIEER